MLCPTPVSIPLLVSVGGLNSKAARNLFASSKKAASGDGKAASVVTRKKSFPILSWQTHSSDLNFLRIESVVAFAKMWWFICITQDRLDLSSIEYAASEELLSEVRLILITVRRRSAKVCATIGGNAFPTCRH